MQLKFDAEHIQKVASSSPKKSGSFNLFFKLNNKVGVKATISAEERDSNYDRQSKAAEYGLGPDVYGKVEFELDNRKFYGYLTEIVPVCDFEYGTKKQRAFIKFHNANIDELCYELMERTGYKFSDSHSYNTGIKNKKLICIDFDDVYGRFERKTRLGQVNNCVSM